MTNRREHIASSLAEVESKIGAAVKASHRSRESVVLIAVTKTYPASDVEILRDLGVTDFGENRDSEGSEKSSLVQGRWHFQGQLQSNKIASITGWADVIHSLDTSKHVDRLDKSVPEGKKLSVFLQVGLDQSPGRGGIEPSELLGLADQVEVCEHLELMGLMAVAPLGENPESAFARLAVIHTSFLAHHPQATALSAGMSGDFEIAIAYGATHIRVGSSILGSRISPL